MELILASQSPRRKQLLEEQGYKADGHPAEIAETISTTMPLDEALERLALDKARAVQPAFPDRTILAADTVVVYGGEILGKPSDDREACDYLMRLSGETHQVKTGVCILTPELATAIFNAKYVNAVPLKRLSEEFLRNDVSIPRQDMAG